MSVKRWATRRDKNEKEVVDALRKAGCFVYPLDQPFDLLVTKQGKIFQIEVKMPKGKLTESQIDYIADNQSVVHVVTSAEEALRVVQ